MSIDNSLEMVRSALGLQSEDINNIDAMAFIQQYFSYAEAGFDDIIHASPYQFVALARVYLALRTKWSEEYGVDGAQSVFPAIADTVEAFNLHQIITDNSSLNREIYGPEMPEIREIEGSFWTIDYPPPFEADESDDEDTYIYAWHAIITAIGRRNFVPADISELRAYHRLLCQAFVDRLDINISCVDYDFENMNRAMSEALRDLLTIPDADTFSAICRDIEGQFAVKPLGAEKSGHAMAELEQLTPRIKLAPEEMLRAVSIVQHFLACDPEDAVEILVLFCKGSRTGARVITGTDKFQAFFDDPIGEMESEDGSDDLADLVTCLLTLQMLMGRIERLEGRFFDNTVMISVARIRTEIEEDDDGLMLLAMVDVIEQVAMAIRFTLPLVEGMDAQASAGLVAGIFDQSDIAPIQNLDEKFGAIGILARHAGEFPAHAFDIIRGYMDEGGEAFSSLDGEKLFTLSREREFTHGEIIEIVQRISKVDGVHAVRFIHRKEGVLGLTTLNAAEEPEYRIIGPEGFEPAGD